MIPSHIASEWLLAILGMIGVLVAYVWQRRDRDMVEFTSKLSSKADKAEMDELKLHVHEMSKISIAAQISLATINEKLGRIASDLESEKGTRSRVNAELFRQIEKNFEALSQQVEILRREIPRYGRRYHDGDEL